MTIHTIIVSGGHDGEQLLKREEEVTAETLEIITRDLADRGFLPAGRHFSISVVSDSADGVKTEIRTGDELLKASQGCRDTILLCFERWDQEERVGAWIEHLERWDKDGLGAAPTDPVKELARAGIPHRLRHEVYNHLARVHDNKEKHPGLYGQYCARIEASCSAKVLSDIDKDLRRTLTSHPAFANSNTAMRTMRRVLAAYALHNPDVAYCQGMSFVVALLLFVTRQYPTAAESRHVVAWEEIEDPEAEEDAFWLLHHLVDRVLPPAYFGAAPGLPQLLGLQRALLVVTRLVDTRQPDLAAHLEALGVPVSCVVVRWLPCLFAGTMPVESVLRVWDMTMAEGMVAVYRAAIAVLEMQRDALIQARESEDIPAAITQVMEELHDASPLVYWMHTSWPWLASWVYPPDITASFTHGLWSEIREAEEHNKQEELSRSIAAAESLSRDTPSEISFLEGSWIGGAALFGPEEDILEGSWCFVKYSDV